MRLAEITAMTFQFHRAVYVSMTEKCPIRCRHCFIDSGPTRTEHADLPSFQRWMDSAVATPVHIFFFSGGEPFSHPRALRYGLKVCAESQKYGVICSSGYWATSPEQAGKVLDSLPEFGCLWLSTDIYHEEFVPLERLRHAAKAARERGRDVVVQIVDDNPECSEFMERFARSVGYDIVGRDQIYITSLGMVGRAVDEVTERPGVRATTLSALENEVADLLGVQVKALSALEKIQDAPCAFLGTPWIREDGVLCACPNGIVFSTRSHPLHLGNLNRASFETLTAQAQSDSYLQVLRTLGPVGLTTHFPVRDWGWDEEAFTGSSICDLCHSLASVPNLPNRVREAVNTQNLMNRIGVLRLLLYGEDGVLLPDTSIPGIPLPDTSAHEHETVGAL